LFCGVFDLRFTRHSFDPCIRENVETFICEQAVKRDLLWTSAARCDRSPSLRCRNVASPGLVLLRRSPTDDKQMFGKFVEFQCLDVGERLRFYQPWNLFQRGPRTSTDDHIRAMQVTSRPVRPPPFPEL
jgi:hypothetical protein